MPAAPGFRWDVDGAPDPDNGHCVIGTGYGAHGVTINTWGLSGSLTWKAIARYCAEANGGGLYAMLSPDQIKKGQSKAPNGLDWAALENDFNEMSGNVKPPAPTRPVGKPMAPQHYEGVTKERFDSLVEQAKAKTGLTISGNAGQASANGFTFKWNYDPAAQTLDLQCLEKPIWAPESAVISTMNQLVGSKPVPPSPQPTPPKPTPPEPTPPKPTPPTPTPPKPTPPKPSPPPPSPPTTGATGEARTRWVPPPSYQVPPAPPPTQAPSISRTLEKLLGGKAPSLGIVAVVGLVAVVGIVGVVALAGDGGRSPTE
jgi:hypothetical protein